MAVSPFWFAQIAVKKGIPANVALAMARDAGVGVRRATFLRMVGEVRSNFASNLQALVAPVRRRPAVSEIGKLPTAVKTGFIQHAKLFRLDKRTGLVDSVERSLISSRLLSMDNVIKQLVDKETRDIVLAGVRAPSWGTLPDSVVLGGIYMSTLRMGVFPEVE